MKENTIYSPYFSVEISNEQLNPLKNKIRSILDNFNIKVTDIPNPHITISYSLGNASLHTLELLAEELAESSFIIKSVGLFIIPSNHYNGNILVLVLENSEDFLYSQGFLKENLEYENDSFTIKNAKAKNGFEAHISLFEIPKMMGKDNFILPKYLEIELGGLNIELRGYSFCIYNINRQKLIEKKFSK